MSDVTLLEKKPAGEVSPPNLPLRHGRSRGWLGEEMDRFTVDEGL
jgi:hypothetical protein